MGWEGVLGELVIGDLWPRRRLRKGKSQDGKSRILFLKGRTMSQSVVYSGFKGKKWDRGRVKGVGESKGGNRFSMRPFSFKRAGK